jgi:hypothetical protein
MGCYSPMPGHVLGAAERANEPRTRAATEPSGPGAKLDPPDHTQPNPATHGTLGANSGQYRRLWPL